MKMTGLRRLAAEHLEGERADIDAARLVGREVVEAGGAWNGVQRQQLTASRRRSATRTAMSRPPTTRPSEACSAMPPMPRRLGTTGDTVPARSSRWTPPLMHVAEIEPAGRIPDGTLDQAEARRDTLHLLPPGRPFGVIIGSALHRRNRDEIGFGDRLFRRASRHSGEARAARRGARLRLGVDGGSLWLRRGDSAGLPRGAHQPHQARHRHHAARRPHAGERGDVGGDGRCAWPAAAASSPASACRARRSSRAGTASPGARPTSASATTSRSCARSSRARRRSRTTAARSRLPYTGPGAMGIGKPLKSILHMNPHIPIYLGTGNESTVKLTAEIADGWLPHGLRARHAWTSTGPGSKRASAAPATARASRTSTIQASVHVEVDRRRGAARSAG